MFDTERQIRFLYPPLFFVASLLLGVRLDDSVQIKTVGETVLGTYLLEQFQKIDWGTPTVALVTAAGLVLTIAAGFLISTVTVAILRLASRLCSTKSYEAVYLSDYQAVRKKLKLAAPFGRPPGDDALFISATLDHEVISRPVHNWVFRRWTMFYVYAHSTTALLFAWLTGRFVLGVSGRWWTTSGAVLGLVFLFLAREAWRDTMGMLRFQARRPFQERKSAHESDEKER